MVDAQDDETSKLLLAIRADLDRWAQDEEIDFQSKYEAAIRSSGEVRFLAALFRRFEGSSLSSALYALPFAWKELPYAKWQEVLQVISHDRDAIYQFIWFVSPFLCLDVLAMIRSDPAVDDAAKEFVRVQFAHGAPRGGDHEREMMERVGVDLGALRRRLAREGAPMKGLP